MKDSVANFLGPILTSNVFISKKLDNTEKDRFDAPITKDELLNTLKNSNMNSAPGIDGISYRFLLKFWNILGNLIYLGIKCIIDKNILSINFRTSKIRLIQKKTGSTIYRKLASNLPAMCML